MSSFAINRVVMVGRLTRDPELRSLPSGRAVCSLRIACNESRLDADGERHERPNYFDVATYGPTAESVARFLHRGSRIGVDGRLEWREWETAEHERRQAVSIVSDVVQFLDGPAASRTNADSEEPEDGGAEDERGELAAVGAEELEVTF
ncbi:MAG TPA: single-stranded DNA-binding protein [Solirubrobacteraceae bacterium]|nr:single-stranded DNA-binding protein [Solirubrobacteraceae bacterium]